MKKLRPACLDQLISYCGWIEKDGTYYGNQKQFIKRHYEIVKWLKDLENDHDHQS